MHSPEIELNCNQYPHWHRHHSHRPQFDNFLLTITPEWRQGWDWQLSSPLRLSDKRIFSLCHQTISLTIFRCLIASRYWKNSATNSATNTDEITLKSRLTYDLCLTLMPRLEGKSSTTAHPTNTLMCTFQGEILYLYFSVFVFVCVCLHTLLSGDNSTSLTSAVLMTSFSLGGEKPDEKQTHRNPTPRHRTKKGFHSEILALVFAFFMKYEWRRFYFVWRREVWQKARPLKPNPCHGTKRGFTLNHWITRSLGALRAPSSSWGPLGLLIFLAQAV